MEWISVEDRLPEPYDGLRQSKPVLMSVTREFGKPARSVETYVTTGRYDGSKWLKYDGFRQPGTVTHWQPLPEPPTKTGE